jgi:hypothetical protein
VSSRPDVRHACALSLCSWRKFVRRDGVYKCRRRLVAMSVKLKPHSRASKIPMERPWISVPCQNPLASSNGVVCSSKIVVTAAARQTVKISRNIQSLAVPRVCRAGPPVARDSHSADNAREDDSLCQKSELAIGGTQTSSFLQAPEWRAVEGDSQGNRSKTKTHCDIVVGQTSSVSQFQSF